MAWHRAPARPSPEALTLAGPAGRSAPRRSVRSGGEGGGRGGRGGGAGRPRASREIPLRPLRPARRAPRSPRRGTSCLLLPRRPPSPTSAACPPPSAAPGGAPEGAQDINKCTPTEVFHCQISSRNTGPNKVNVFAALILRVVNMLTCTVSHPKGAIISLIWETCVNPLIYKAYL